MNTMKHFTISNTLRNKYFWILFTAILAVLLIAAAGLFIGKYPLTVEGILANEGIQRKVFLNLRLSRVVTSIVGGFALGVSGFVYQTVFRNPLASPDIIGVASGASAGAAAGILFLSGAAAVTFSAFTGAILAVILTLILSGLDKTGKNSTTVLAGIAVHALAQTVLMVLKLSADPEKELSSIEYWIMGSLNGISMHSIGGNLLLCLICLIMLFFLHRQIILLSTNEGEGRMLGIHEGKLRLFVLLIATLTVSSIISLTGLISFVGLLAPHTARLITKENRIPTMALSGLFGSILLCGSDILARSVSATELPVSIFTSLLGAPFLIYLIVRERRNV